MKSLHAAALSILVVLPATHSASHDHPEAIILPVRVLRLNCDVEPRLNCTLTHEEIRAQFAIVNQTWDQAKIVWEIESIADVAAAQPEDFSAAMENPRGRLARALVANVSRNDLLKDGFNVVIAEDYGRSMGGVFVPQSQGIVFYARRGPKGIQTPAVLAHELGHALGLPHTVFEKNNNLMMGSGPGREPTPTKPITRSQIKIARSVAETGKPFVPNRPAAPASGPQMLWAILDANGDSVMTAEEVQSKHRAFAIDFLRRASRAPDDSLSRIQFDTISQQQRRQRQAAQSQRRGQSNTPSKRAWGPEIVPQMFARFDANQDNAISRAEAGRPGSLVHEYFDTWDNATNQDGVLTREEITARLTDQPVVQGALRNPDR